MGRIKFEIKEEKLHPDKTDIYVGQNLVYIKIEGRSFLKYKPELSFEDDDYNWDYHKWNFSKNGVISFDGWIKDPMADEIDFICKKLLKLDPTLEMKIVLEGNKDLKYDDVILVLTDKKLRKITGVDCFFRGRRK